MEELFLICCLIFLPYYSVTGDSFSTVVPINVELNSTIKSPLRYGFQKTSKCLNFEKSFICIQKCLDLNYDVAYADENCKCTCHIKKEKAKYTSKHSTRTIWKLGAPTTSIPPWAQHKKKTEEPDPQLIAEVDEADPTEAMDNVESNNSTKVPATPNSPDDKSSDNTKVTSPEGLVQSGTGEGSLTDGATIENLTSASSGTESGGAATVANLATEAAPDTAITTAHDGTNAPIPEESVVTQAA